VCPGTLSLLSRVDVSYCPVWVCPGTLSLLSRVDVS